MPSPFPLKYLVHEMPNKLWHGSFLIEDRLFIIDTIESPVYFYKVFEEDVVDR